MKGISSIIAAVILMVISIVGSAITYRFVGDFMGNTMDVPAAIPTVIPIMLIESLGLESYYVKNVHLRNLGATTVAIDKAYLISASDGAIADVYDPPNHVIVPPGQLTTIDVNLMAPRDGNYYVKIVSIDGRFAISKQFNLNRIYLNKWIEYPSNPIFDPDIRAYYPCVIYDANEFNGHGVSAKYKMWFNSYFSGAYSIWFAHSSDGLVWNLHSSPVSGLSSSAGHPWVLYFPNGFIGANSGNNPSSATMYYRIWYWDANKLYTVEAIRYAESPDGLNWYNDQPLKNGDVPIVTGSYPDWNRGSYGPACVLYNPLASNSGVDWTFRMYYDGTSGANESIGVGFSRDGITWTGYDRNGDGKADPVLTGSGSGWDAHYVYPCTVLKKGPLYHMIYSGGVNGTNEGIGYAISTDGLNWIKDPSNPIFHKSDGVAWRSSRTYTPAVIEVEGKFKMYFTGVDSTGNYAIGYAYSK